MYNTLPNRSTSSANQELRNPELVYNPQIPRVCFSNKDTRVLHDKSVFEEYDALRKSYQYDKDFFNDQDSIAGPATIPTLIKNILCTRIGSLSHDLNFGVDLTPFLFEQLDWVSIIAIRDVIANALYTNLPTTIEVENVDIRANEDKQANTITIDITYSYIGPDEDEFFDSPKSAGPGKNLNTRSVEFSLGVDGFTGFGLPSKTRVRKAEDLTELESNLEKQVESHLRSV